MRPVKRGMRQSRRERERDEVGRKTEAHSEREKGRDTRDRAERDGLCAAPPRSAACADVPSPPSRCPLHLSPVGTF